MIMVVKMQLIPKWTKKGKLKEGGRDPLGLSAISERITSDLVPGIITKLSNKFYLFNVSDLNKPNFQMSPNSSIKYK